MDEELRRRLTELRRLLGEGGKPQAIPRLIVGLHPSDTAQLLRYLEPQEKLRAFRQIPSKMAAPVLAEMDDSSLGDILQGLPSGEISRLLARMPADDATDIVAELTADQQKEVLDLIPHEDSAELQELLRYEPDTAGGIMDPDFVAVDDAALVVEAIEALRAAGEVARWVRSIHVVDRFGHLLGLVPVQELLLASPVDPVTKLMITDIVRIPIDMDQEEVARSFRRYNLVSAPVVDQNGVLVGRISVEDVLEVMEEEADEDASLLAGTADEEFHERSAFRISRLRLPWLLVGLAGEFVAAQVVGHFEGLLHSLLALAFFVPLVTAMAGNAATQASAVVVRGLATGEVDVGHMRQRIFKELRVALINGLACGAIITAAASLWRDNFVLGLVVGLAMLGTMTMATVLGAAVPLMFRRFNLDPALASGPFVTTSNDILGVLVYLSLATGILAWLG